MTKERLIWRPNEVSPDEWEILSRDEQIQWWKDNANAPSDLTFVYDIHLGVHTSYEPITRQAISGQQLWISEVMSSLGYDDTSYFTQVRSYLNDLRHADETDWAFAFFVADSLNDPDGKFLDGRSMKR